MPEECKNCNKTQTPLTLTNKVNATKKVYRLYTAGYLSSWILLAVSVGMIYGIYGAISIISIFGIYFFRLNMALLLGDLQYLKNNITLVKNTKSIDNLDQGQYL